MDDKNRTKRIDALEKTAELIKSGYAGINRSGNIVDRRENEKAVPIPENRLMETPKPKKL
jgi:hypothetical protein